MIRRQLTDATGVERPHHWLYHARVDGSAPTWHPSSALLYPKEFTAT